MAEISSTKKNIDLAKREYEKVLITSSYAMTGTWTNVPNWTLTIPLTGRYKFIAAGVMIAYSGSTATNVEAGVRLALNGTFIPGTPKSTGWSSNGATYAYQRVPFEVTWEDNFTAGAVVTLQAAELGGATDCTIAYTSSEDEFYMSYESVAVYVPVVDTNKLHTLSEIDTGQTWIDGKRIYRKTIDFGALPSTANKAVAHGITTLDKMVSFNAFADNGTIQLTIPQSQSTDSFSIHIYFSQTDIQIQTWDNYSAYSAYVSLEYTKA